MSPPPRRVRQRDVERLTGRHPMRRRALWVQRSVVPFTLAACLLGVLVGAAAISAVKRGAGWDDPRITAVTTTATTPDPHRVDLDCWVATAGWTDPRGGSYVGTVSIPVDAPIGTAVPARLAADGAVRTAAGGAADMWTVLLLVGLGIGLVVIGGWAGGIPGRPGGRPAALRLLADRLVGPASRGARPRGTLKK